MKSQFQVSYFSVLSNQYLGFTTNQYFKDAENIQVEENDLDNWGSRSTFLILLDQKDWWI